jgi:ribonuclease HII
MIPVNREEKGVQKWIIGIDEVGRGPLAGPVTVAAVVAPETSFFTFHSAPLNGIRDSKKMNGNQRKRWNTIIKNNFTCAIVSINNNIIDKRGIVYATHVAVSRCLKKILHKQKLEKRKLTILLDGGLHAPPEYNRQKTIIKGDEKEPLIAAASIVAKVHRDQYMTRLAKRYPHYGFERHKGYGTAKHREAIKMYGLSDMHRKSFSLHLL